MEYGLKVEGMGFEVGGVGVAVWGGARILERLQRLIQRLGFRIQGFITQSKVVAQLTLLVAVSVLHRSCSVAAEPKTTSTSPRRL